MEIQLVTLDALTKACLDNRCESRAMNCYTKNKPSQNIEDAECSVSVPQLLNCFHCTQRNWASFPDWTRCWAGAPSHHGGEGRGGGVYRNTLCSFVKGPKVKVCIWRNKADGRNKTIWYSVSHSYYNVASFFQHGIKKNKLAILIMTCLECFV